MNILDIAIAKKLAGGGGGSGTDNYNDLSNLPKINDTTLSGNKSSSALGLQSEINSDSKLASDLVDDTNQDNKFVTSTEKNTWNGKQNAIDSDHKLSSDLVDDANHTNKFVTSTEKNTWNAKQNAIDADHKLSSSLVSFSTAEAAALASGIDSSKVEQISTNQTNILYSLQTGVKNLFNLEADEKWSYSLSSQTVDTKTGTLSITSNSDWARVGIPITLPAGKYVISGNVTSLVGNALLMGNTEKYDSGTAVFTDIEITTTGAFTANFTLNSATTLWVTLYANFSSSIVRNSVTITGMMICTKAAWDQEPNVFRPFAAPNYDLTRLQSEDRNALAEQVDEGAKNEFIFGEFGIGSSANVSIANNAVTVSGEQAWAKGYRIFRVTKNTTYVLSFRVTNVATVASPKYSISIGKDSGSGGSYYGIISCNTTGNYYMIFTPPTDTDIYMLVTSNNSPTAASDTPSITVDNIMVCTEADWKVSQNYAPYALPNTDLTQRQSEDREDINGLLESVDNWFDTTLCHGIETNQMISRVDVDSSITISTKSGATGNTDGYETKMLIDITEFPSGSFTLWLDFISGTVQKQWLGFRITMLDENMNVIPSAQLYKYKSANNTGLHKIGTISVQALIDSGVRYFRPVIWISGTNPYSNAKFKVYVTDGELTPSDQGYNISRIGLENHINNIDVENLLPFPYSFSSYTRSDADIVVDDDGAISITSNGALASDIRLNLIPNTPNTPNSMLPLEVGKQYVYDAGTELGSNDPEYTAFVELWESPTASTRKSAITLAKDYLDDTKIVFTADAPYCRCYIKLHSGYTTDGTVTYRPTFKKGTAESSCVPYNQSRLALRTDMNKLLCAPTLVTTGSLDNFTDTSFCAVDSNVSGKPTGVTGNCFVRTSKMSDTYIMQECFSASGAYYRIYDTNTWSVWMQLSNV